MRLNSRNQLLPYLKTSPASRLEQKMAFGPLDSNGATSPHRRKRRLLRHTHIHIWDDAAQLRLTGRRRPGRCGRARCRRTVACGYPRCAPAGVRDRRTTDGQHSKREVGIAGYRAFRSALWHRSSFGARAISARDASGAPKDETTAGKWYISPKVFYPRSFFFKNASLSKNASL